MTHQAATSQHELGRLRAEVAALRAELLALRAEVGAAGTRTVTGGRTSEEPAAGPASRPPVPGGRPGADGPVPGDRTTDRRRLLARAGMAAGAAVAGVAASTALAPAAGAADGDNLVLGVGSNAATSTTVTEYEGAGPAHGFVVGDGTGPATTSAGAGALVGKANYLANGVLAISETPGRNSLRALATGADSAAVYATASGSNSDGVRATGTRSAIFSEQAIWQADVVGVLMSGGRRGLRSDGSMTFPLSTAPFQGSDGLSNLPASVGDWFVDTVGDVYYCVADGAPGTYRLVTGPGTAGAFVATDPRRVYDSRLSGGALAHGQSRVVGVADAINPFTGAVEVAGFVPAGATAVAYNLTVTGTVGSGYVQVAPGDATSVTASSINWTATGQTIANGLVVRLDAARRVKVFAAGTGSSAHVVIDVLGYHR